MNYAIIRTGGKQFRAESGKTLRVPSLLGDAGTSLAASLALRAPGWPRLTRKGSPDMLLGCHVTSRLVFS